MRRCGFRNSNIEVFPEVEELKRVMDESLIECCIQSSK